MGERYMTSVIGQLSTMKPPREDLISMIHLNGPDLPELIPYDSLINICAEGLTYGAMRTVCPTCKTILHGDGEKYQCSRKLLKRSSCNYYRYHVETSTAPWEIPESVTKQELKTLKRKSRNYQAESFLDPEQKKQRKNVLMCAHAHKYRHIIEDGTRLTFENIPYQYFLVMNDDLIGNYQKTDDSTGTSSHCFGQIYSIEENPTRYVFYKWEQVCNKEMQYFYDYSSAVEAIERFEEQFLHATGNPWKSWIEKDFVRIASRFFPLEMDYYSRLRYRKAQKVDEIHEEIAVKLEHLKKLKINEKEITEVSIQKAQNSTVRIVMEAHDILEGFKKLEVQGTHQKMVSAVKNQLKFLDDEEDLKFCSIVSRLLTSPVGTTIRLVDLPQKFDFFQPIGKILSVFFDYQKLQQKCLPPPPDLPHQIWPSSARELTQQYMLDKIRGVIGSWIMTLFFSPNEQMHHYYVKQKDSGCCYWSVLLRKARKALDESSSDCFILCTMDVEELPERPEHDMARDATFTDKQTNMEEILWSKIDERDYDKYGFIHHTENRAKVVMLFPIKYNGWGVHKTPKGFDRWVSAGKLNHDEMNTWIDFISCFYSPVIKPDKSLIYKAKGIYGEKSTPLIYLGEADEKYRERSVLDYFTRFGF